MTTTSAPLFIALDPGFGNTKVAIDGRVSVLQSAVARPRQIGLAGIGMKVGQQADQVRLESGALYAAGEFAWLAGDPIGGMDYASIAGEPRRALFYAAATRLLSPGGHQGELVVGLPVPLLQNEAEAATVLNALRQHYKCCHHWEIGGMDYNLEITGLKVLAQPVGAYADWLLSEELKARKGSAAAEVAVLDIGMNTLDLYVIQGGRIVSRFIGGARVGVRRLLATMNGHGEDLEELDAWLRSGARKPAAEDLESWCTEILGHVERTWSSLKRFTAVVPAGGGSLVLGDLLRRALVDRGAAVAWPADPVAANVQGLWKWAAYNARNAKAKR